MMHFVCGVRWQFHSVFVPLRCHTTRYRRRLRVDRVEKMSDTIFTREREDDGAVHNSVSIPAARRHSAVTVCRPCHSLYRRSRIAWLSINR